MLKKVYICSPLGGDELWWFGDTVTAGMQKEIDFCKNLNIRVLHIKDSEVIKTIGGN